MEYGGCMKTNKLLEERGKTHGDFGDNARISQTLKDVVKSIDVDQFNVVQLEALDMICLKLSRIASGQADVVDHWADIAGYAQLVVNDLENEKM